MNLMQSIGGEGDVIPDINMPPHTWCVTNCKRRMTLVDKGMLGN